MDTTVGSKGAMSNMINVENASEETALLSNDINGDDGNPKSWTMSVSWTLCCGLLAVVSTMGYAISVRTPQPIIPLPTISVELVGSSIASLPDISVAFIGNSITFFNDLPRFLETISEGHLEQNSCLHGVSSLTSMLERGNGMFQTFNTSNALNNDGVYDYGACTVKQLLLGHDDELEEKVLDHSIGEIFYNDMNGANPCVQDPSYLKYLDTHAFKRRPHWNFIVLNDHTQYPARAATRDEGLLILREVYVPWFLETKATPVFFDTHAYWSDVLNMSGLIDIPTFTSLTYQGYQDYVSLVTKLLPPSQAPRLAPVGVAFLTVWEENRHLWHKLFHKADRLHPSPSGTFLTGAIIHFALFGEMPRKQVMLPHNHDLSILWARARVMQNPSERQDPLPTFKDAKYLYDVADRVARKGHLPRALIRYKQEKAAAGGT